MSAIHQRTSTSHLFFDNQGSPGSDEASPDNRQTQESPKKKKPRKGKKKKMQKAKMHPDDGSMIGSSDLAIFQEAVN